MSKLTGDELYNEAFIIASGSYLTEYLPTGFNNWEDEELEKFVEDNIWEGVENLEACEVVKQMGQTASIMVRFLEDYR